MDSQHRLGERQVGTVQQGGRDTAESQGAPEQGSSTGSIREQERARVYERLLGANAALLTALIALSFILPISEVEHWSIGLACAGLLGLNVAMVDEARKRSRQYLSCEPEGERPVYPEDLFVNY